MSKTYRIGIVGIGGIAKMHALAIGDIENAELVAGSCRTESKGRAFADEHGCRWHADYQTLLDEEKPDAITIATPSGAHLEPMLAAAERGIHGLCEKPLEITLDRIDRMIDTARRHNITLGGIFPQRFNPVLRQVHQAAASGRFGRIATANAYVPWWREDDYYAPERWQGTLQLDGGGALMNQSIHGVDAIQWLAGATMKDLHETENPVTQVFAFTDKLGHDPDLLEVEDTCVAVLRYRNGALGQILAATSLWPGDLRRLQIAGRDGTAEIMEEQLLAYRFRNEQPDDEQTRQRFSGESTTTGGAADPMAIDYSNHTRNIEGFLRALEGDTSLILDAPEARKAVAIIEAIYESAQTGQPTIVK